jgi:hypothetical protein
MTRIPKNIGDQSFHEKKGPATHRKVSVKKKKYEQEETSKTKTLLNQERVGI